jgi:two-component system probable response regulator PhcQ
MPKKADQHQLIVLYVDDEPQALKYFEKAFKDDFAVRTAESVEEARALIERETGQIAVVISDQRMPSAKGVDLLSWVRLARPHAVRILTTAFSDLDSAIEAVNDGAIFRYVTKPWDIRDLRGTLMRALDLHRLQCDRELLMREKTEVLQRLIIIDQVRSYLSRLASPLDLATRSLSAAKSGVPDTDSDMLQAIDGVTQGISRIKGIVAELRSFADPIRDHDREAFAIEEAIERSLLQPTIAPFSSRISVACQAHAEVLAVKAEVVTIIGHLLANAVEATMRVVDGRQAQITVSSRRRERRLQVTIHDNGIGIPPMNLPRIFDPFFTTKEAVDGMGLGLTICRTIVMHHGGHIQMRSEYNRWTEVVFDLPLAIPPA